MLNSHSNFLLSDLGRLGGGCFIIRGYLRFHYVTDHRKFSLQIFRRGRSLFRRYIFRCKRRSAGARGSEWNWQDNSLANPYWAGRTIWRNGYAREKSSYGLSLTRSGLRTARRLMGCVS